MVTKNKDKTDLINIKKPSRKGIGLKNVATYEEFIVWYALPRPEKIKLGLEDQGQFGEYHHISEQTLSKWVGRPDFLPSVRALWKKWGQGRTPNVVAAIYNTAISGGREAPQSQKLWMQIIEDWSEKTEVSETKKVEVGINDVRFIIDGLPEPQRTKFYGYIDEIVIFANEVRNAIDADETTWDERPENQISGETDNDAQVIPIEGPNELARSHTPSLRRYLVGQTPTRDHQSTSWWWQKQVIGNDWL